MSDSPAPDPVAADLGEIRKRKPPPILCAHADQDGAGAHWLAPGEKCPLAERGDSDA